MGEVMGFTLLYYMDIPVTSQPIGVLPDPYHVWFVSSRGVLFRVTCPFRVVCIRAYIPYRVGDLVIVEQVESSLPYPILYRINQVYIPHSYFHLLL